MNDIVLTVSSIEDDKQYLKVLARAIPSPTSQDRPTTCGRRITYIVRHVNEPKVDPYKPYHQQRKS